MPSQFLPSTFTDPGAPPESPPELLGEVEMQMVDEAVINWGTQTAGTVGATYVDTVTGATWTRGIGGSMGTISGVISSAGLTVSGTAGAADQSWQLYAYVDDLINTITDGPAYDSELDVVEIVHTVSGIACTAVFSQVAVDYMLQAGSVVIRTGRTNSSGGIQNRLMLVSYSGTGITRTALSTDTQGVWAGRFTPIGIVPRYNSSKAFSRTFSGLTAWDSSKNRWSIKSDTTSGANLDSTNGRALIALYVLGQATGALAITLETTTIRRWRGVVV